MAWILSAFADEAGAAMDDQIRALQMANIDHVDLRQVDDITIVDLPLDHAEQVRAKLDAAGIKVGMFGSPIGKIDVADDFEIDRKRLAHLGKLKDVFDCRAVRLFSYYDKEGDSPDEHRRQSLERLQRLTDDAARLELVLYHENERGIYGESIEAVCQIRDALRGEHFKLIFDFNNYHHAGENVWAGWLALRDTTDAFHLKDSKFTESGDMHMVPVGQGEGRVPKILADAAKRGWDGPLTLEPHLQFSKAVQATGPGGVANQSFADMTAEECFLVAAEAAHQQIAAAQSA